MGDDTSKQTGGASPLTTQVLDELSLPLEELVRRGARQLIQRAIEVEVEALLGQYETVTLLDGRWCATATFPSARC